MARNFPQPGVLSAHAAVLVSACLACAMPASAQTGRVALDAVVAVDGDVGSSVRREPGVWFDVFGAFRVADGLDLVARPVFSRRTFDGIWQKQMYQLGVRYELPLDVSRGRRIGFRIEGGQMPSPIGIGMLENRADLNPVISQHSAYYLPLPRVDPEIPRSFFIAAAYPLGAQMTIAAQKWDVRWALIDSSPVRGRPFFGPIGPNKPPRLANWVAGFGVTPRVGLRLGAAYAYGPYASANESFIRDRSKGNRIATMLQFEGEWSFGYTRLAGEVLRTTLETARDDAHVEGGWIEITQTLHPRVFIAARADGQTVDYQTPAGAPGSQNYQRYEAIGGFRITPDLTVRAGYMVRKGYVVFHWDDQFLVSVVWQKKIF